MAFPTNTQYTPITVGGVVYADIVNDESPASTDIVGNASLPSFYYAYDGMNVYFRMRLRSDPRNSQGTGFQNFSWGVLFNTNGTPGTYQWLLNVNGIDNIVSLVRNTVEQSNSWNDPAEGTNGRGAPNYSVPIVNFDVARVVPAGSTLGNSTNYFLDFFISAARLFSFLGINENSPLRLIAFTSANANNYNKDSLQTAEGFSFQQAASNPVTPASGDVRAKLQITKSLTSGSGSITAGQSGQWTGTITVRNTGKSQATTIFVNDTANMDIFTSLTVTNVTQGTTVLNPNTNILTWNVGNLNPNVSATLTFTQSGTFTTAGSRTLDTASASGIDSNTGFQITAGPSVIPITVQATGGVTGIITDAVTGLRIAGAAVQLGPSSAQTDVNGAYSFTNVTPGNYSLQIAAANYQPLSLPISVTSGQVTTASTALTPVLGSIEGTVSGPGPILNAQVTITNALGIVVAQPVTNAAGFYSAAGLSPGTYTVSVAAAGFQSQTAAATVTSGTAAAVNFTLAQNPGIIQGTVGSSGGALAGASLILLTPEGIPIDSTTSNGVGFYQFNTVAPGNYRVNVSLGDFGIQTIGAAVSAGQTETVNFTLVPNAGSLTGAVRGADGSPIEKAGIRIVNQAGITAAVAATATDGSYAVNTLPPGSYTVIFSAEGYGTVTLGATIISGQPTALDASLSRLAGTLRGTVTGANGTALPGAAVSVFLNNVFVTSVLTDDNGSYTITGLADGSYTVTFSAADYGTEILGAVIAANSETVLNGSLIQNAGSLRGTVTNGADGLAGAVVIVQDAGTETIAARAITAADGSYIVADLAPGQYEVTVSFPSFQTQVKGAVIAPSLQTVLNFTLPPNPAAITGQITNEQTQLPISGANIQIRVLDSNGVRIASTFTDENGLYTVTNLPPGTYSVVVSNTDFQTNTATTSVPAAETAIVNLTLAPNPGFIAGAVQSAGGAPIAGAVVRITNGNGILLATSITGNEGQFLSPGLPPDNYMLTASATTFTTDFVGAVVSPNTTTPVVITLGGSPGSITGTLTPANLSNPMVRLFTSDNVFVDAVSAGSDGSYIFSGLPAGLYTVIASADNFASTAAGAIVPQGGTAAVDLTLEPQPAVISGRITQAASIPIPTASIRVLDASNVQIASGTTDENGLYSIGGLAPGTYTVAAGAVDFGTANQAVALSPNQQLENVDFRLTADTGSIAGQITDSFGNPIAGAAVLVRDSGNVLVATAATSSFGNFVIPSLTPGSYTVTATAPDFSTETVGAIVQSNSSASANISLTSSVGDIAGTVVDPNGVPVTGNYIQVRLLTEQGLLLQTVLAQPDGSFQFIDLASGAYLLNASAPLYGANTVSAAVAAPSTTNVTVPIQLLPATVNGTVTNPATGAPIAGATVKVTSASGIPLVSVSTEISGNFTIPNVPAGVLNISITAPGFGSVTTTVDVQPDETVFLPIVLNPNIGSVSGLVTNLANAQAIAGAVITVFTPGNVIIKMAVTDAGGQYAVTGLAPGLYRVVVSAADFTAGVLTVDVQSDLNSQASFALSPDPGFIAGAVRETGTGTPLAGVTVQVRYLTPSGPVISTVLTDESGRYRTTGLEPGTYTLIAFSENYGNQSSSALVQSNTDTSLHFVLFPNPASLTGIVTDGQRPLPNTTVRLLDINGAIVQTTETGFDGTYNFTGIAPGQYTVIAINPDYVRQLQSFAAAAGVTASVSFILVGNPSSLIGAVTDFQTRSPLPGALVEVFPVGSTFPIARRTTDGLGQYLIEGLAPGEYTVVTSLPNYAAQTAGVSLPPGQTGSADIILIPNPASVSGAIRSTGGAPINNATVLFSDQNGVVIGTGVTDVNGNYVVSSLPAGVYTISITAPGFSNRLSGITLEPGDTVANLNFILEANQGTVTGTVTATGDGPVPGALVSLLLNGVLITSTATNEDGGYTLSGVAPGSYTVTAFKEGLAQGQAGAVVASGITTVTNIVLNALTGQITGVVTNTSGAPVTDIVITLRLADSGAVIIRTLQAQTDGSFVISDIAPGSYVLTASASGFQPNSVSVSVASNQTTFTSIALAAGAGGVRGEVRDASTGSLIAGSVVTVTNMGGIVVGTAVTGADGSFLIPNVPAGTNNISAGAAGYGTISRSVIIVAGQTAETSLLLPPNPGSIAGTVGANGVPISGANIQVIDSTGAVIANVLTSSSGKYLVPSLAPGVYTVTASAPGLQLQASSAFVASQEVTILDFQLSSSFGDIAGTVRSPGGAGIAGAIVQLRIGGAAGPIVSSIVTAADGSFAFEGLAPNEYSVTASAPGFGTAAEVVQLQAGEIETVVLLLVPLAGAVQGTVRSSTVGTPLPDTVVRLVTGSGAIIIRVQTDAAGNYFIGGIPPGSYFLTFVNADFQSITIPIVIRDSETLQQDAALLPNPAQITGVVADRVTGLPIAGAVLIIFDSAGLPVTNALTNSNGRYILQGLAAGSYTVVASAAGYEDPRLPITLSSGETAVLDFPLQRASASVSGRVTDAAGNPIAQAAVRIFAADGRLIAEATTALDGSYSINGLPGGTFTTTVVAPGFQTQSRTVTLAADQQVTGFDFVLQSAASGSITGTVIDAQTGCPIAGATVKLQSQDAGLITILRTDDCGRFRIDGLPSGTCTLTVVKPFYSKASSFITVSLGDSTSITIYLQPLIPNLAQKILYRIFLKSTCKLFVPPGADPVDAVFVLKHCNATCASFLYTDRNGSLQSITFNLSCIQVSPVCHI